MARAVVWLVVRYHLYSFGVEAQDDKKAQCCCVTHDGNARDAFNLLPPPATSSLLLGRFLRTAPYVSVRLLLLPFGCFMRVYRNLWNVILTTLKWVKRQHKDRIEEQGRWEQMAREDTDWRCSVERENATLLLPRVQMETPFAQTVCTRACLGVCRCRSRCHSLSTKRRCLLPDGLHPQTPTV